MRDRYGIEWRITGVGSRRLGWQVKADGFDAGELLGAQDAGAFAKMGGHKCSCLRDWLDAAQPEVVFEATSLNVESGQPAVEHIRGALEYGAGMRSRQQKVPIGARLRRAGELAMSRGKQFLFESTVMDGAPIFSLFGNALPAVEVKGFQGILELDDQRDPERHGTRARLC